MSEVSDKQSTPLDVQPLSASTLIICYNWITGGNSLLAYFYT